MANAAECDIAPRAPAGLRPDFTATIGLARATREAIRTNLRGLPNDSRYSAITDVASSASQYRSRSLPEMSALLPTDTKLEMPMPRRAALVDQRDAECPGLRHERDVARDRVDRREGRIHLDRRVGVGESHAVGADDSHAVTPRRFDQRCFDGAAGRAELGKAGADDDDAADVRRPAFLDHPGHGVGGHRDDGQIGRPWRCRRRLHMHGCRRQILRSDSPEAPHP